MEKDEQGTFERLRSGRKELFEPEIARHHGRIFKLMGDGLLAEFGSVVDAVECAVSLQRGLAERNVNISEDRRIKVRIGINLGEVIVEGDDCYGDGVNIAARLEQLADPGGICVSAKVAREVEKTLSFGFEEMGEQKVKNITEPIQTFRVKFDGIPLPLRRSGKKIKFWPAAMGSLFALMIAGGGAWYALQPPKAHASEPSIAVLPFANMSGDPAQNYFGAGIAEDIITMLSSFPSLRVVSRTSSFVYDKPVKVQQVGDDLKVNYVIEGSVRRAGDKVRVTAQLINASTGEHVWANRYDEESGDVAALQNNVANKIYDTLAGLSGKIRKQEEADAWTKSAPSLEEYDYYLRGHQLFFQITKEGNEKARAVWQEGLNKFPDSTLLRTKIAFTYIRDVYWESTDDPWGVTEKAWKLGTEAQATEHKSRLETLLSHWVMVPLYQLHEGDFERSVVEAMTAGDLVPYDAFARTDLGSYLVNAGKYDLALQWLEDSIRRDPTPQDFAYGALGIAYYFADRPSDSLTALKKMKEPWKTSLAVAYVRLGMLEEARAIMATFRKDNPNWTIEKEALWPTTKKPQYAEPFLKTYLADLTVAGLPMK